MIDNKVKNIPTLNKQSFCCKFLFMNTWADHVARLLDNITHCVRADSEQIQSLRDHMEQILLSAYSWWP